MNIRTRFLTFLAAAAAVFTGCQQQEADFDLPSIKIEGSGITVDNETKKASFSAPKDLTAITLGVTATRDWKAEIEWDADEVPWINVSPEEGDGTGRTQEVKVTILDNPGYNRAKQIKFNINYDYKTLYITQSGEKGEEIVGTLENPFTVAGVNKYVKTLGSDVQSPNEVYVKGKISKIADAGTFSEGGTFGNATFYISDDGTPNNEFYCYRILYLGNKKFKAGQTDIKVGDDVIICGKVVNYKGNTPETVQSSAFLYELNGVSDGGEPTPTGDPKGTGTVDDPYNPAGAANAVKDLTWTSNEVYDATGDVYVKGIITRIADKGTFTDGGTYGNASFYISEDGTSAGEFYCYRILYLGNKKFQSGQTDIKVGDEVIICGQLMNYRGNTPETVAGKAYLYSLNGKTDGGDTPPGPSGEAKGTGTLDDPYNALGAANAVKDLTWTSNTEYQSTGDVYIKGKISRIANKGTFTEGGTYGNASFYISDDGKEANEFYCFRVLYLGNKKFEEGQTDIKVGDEVVVYGQLMNYQGNTPETVAGKAYLYSLNGNGGGGDTPGGEIKAMTIAAYLAEPVSTTQWYELTGTVSNIANPTYGNFDLTDDSGKVYVYGLCATKVEKNDKSFASLDIKEGDNITIITLRSEHNGSPQAGGSTPAYLKSKNGGGTPSTEGTGTLEDPYTAVGAAAAVKDLTWTSNTDYQKTEKVYVKGKISRIANKGTYTEGGSYGNASYYISADGTENGEFYIFRSLYFNGEKYTAGTDIKVGDEVIVYGSLMNYQGKTPETVAGENWLYSLNGKTDGGGSVPPSGGTLDNPYTVAQALDAVKDLTWTSNTEYESTDEVYMKGKISKIASKGTFTEGGSYGNASFYISDDGTETNEFYCFRVLYLENKKFEEGQTDIKVGDEVVVCGKLMNYKGNTPETVSGKAYLYSLNGKTEPGSGGGDTPAAGTVDNPYTVAQALDAVKDLTWTSNTEYESTDEVYMKGKISKVASKGTFTEGGSYGNASFYISDDGTETNEFYCFRILYLGNKKFEEGQTDIKVGDEVVICGKLMNYKGNTPETVSGKAYLYSLKSAPGGGGDTPAGNTVSFATNKDAQTWEAATDGTYGSGFGTTTQGLNIAYYKHTSSNNPVAPNENHVRVYKNAALSIASADGKKIKKIVIGCAPNAGTSSYCFDMAGLEGGASATCDKDALTVTWTGSATKVILHANNGQIRMEKLTVEFE